jgi:hypothetical protein
VDLQWPGLLWAFGLVPLAVVAYLLTQRRRRGEVRATPVGCLTAVEVALLAGSPQPTTATARQVLRGRLTAQLATPRVRPARPRQSDYGGHRSRPAP